MSGAATTTTPDNIPDFKQTMGHPRPLWMLFMTEFWERFAFYGIRWALVLYIVAQFHGGQATGEDHRRRARASNRGRVLRRNIIRRAGRRGRK